MLQVHIYQVPLVAIGVPAALVLIRYLMVYIGFRVTLRRAHPNDYPAVYREYVRGLSLRGARLAEVIKIVRPAPAPLQWVQRDPGEIQDQRGKDAARPDRFPVAR
jgi:hypothetical protein